jgi:hypothetical protein
LGPIPAAWVALGLLEFELPRSSSFVDAIRPFENHSDAVQLPP